MPSPNRHSTVVTCALCVLCAGSALAIDASTRDTTTTADTARDLRLATVVEVADLLQGAVASGNPQACYPTTGSRGGGTDGVLGSRPGSAVPVVCLASTR